MGGNCYDWISLKDVKTELRSQTVLQISISFCVWTGSCFSSENVFRAPSMWLLGDLSHFSKDGGFLTRMGIFPEVTIHSVLPPANGGLECSTSWQVEPTGALSLGMSGDLGPEKGDVRLSLWWWVRSRSRGVLRRDEVLDLQRSSGRDPGERGALGSFWARAPSGGYKSLVYAPLAREPLLLFACILALACIVVPCEQSDSDWHKRHFRTWTSGEWVYVPEAQGEHVELLPLSRL